MASAEVAQLSENVRHAKKKYAAEPENKPKIKTGRNLVICCDGTNNEFGAQNTNVVKLFGWLVKDPARQLAYYNPGVGTLSPPHWTTRPFQRIAKIWGLAFGYGLTANIEDAYKFLMDNYKEGDTVFLFGFSRGAYTVRLAGMIHECGLLPKGSDNLIRYATKMSNHPSKDLKRQFKTFFTSHIECKPHFVGVWDTVKSVSFFVQQVFPATDLNPDVNFGRHALALHEQRGMYMPVLWTEDPQEPGSAPTEAPRIKQVWFAGVHSDVGGGYPETALSDISLKWMLNEACAQGLELLPGWEKGCQGTAACQTAQPHNSLLPWWWILPFCRRHVPENAHVHDTVPSPKEIKAPVGRVERWTGAAPSYLLLGAVGFALPFLFWLLERAFGSLAPLTEESYRAVREYYSQESHIVLGLWGALGMILVGLVVWGIRWWNGGD